MSEKDILIEAAQAGGKVLKKYFGQFLNVVEKSMMADFKTEADIGSEEAILKILKAKLPRYNIHSEEEGKLDNNSEYTIVIDPLDGTNNFVLGIPNFSVSIALLHNNEAIAGVVYQPISDQMYVAEKGKGAFLNGKKIGVNNIVNPGNMTIAYNCGYKTEHDRIAQVFVMLEGSPHKRILFNWSPAYDYCLLASGKIESVITDPGTEIYDYGAGKLIAKEAGAKIVDFNGKEETNYISDSFIVSNSEEVNKYVSRLIKVSR